MNLKATKYLKKIVKKILPPGLSFQSRPKNSNNKSAPVFDRKERILSKIKPGVQEGLEIGPLCSPIVSKRESNGHVWYVDHTSTEGLQEKYKNDPDVPAKEIVNIDFIWGNDSLTKLVNGNLYDYLIASHVIEHIADMLGWMIEISEVLKDNGILSLAVPDKRYTFDFLRELSTPGKLIEAYLRHPRRPGPQEIFDFLSSYCDVDVVSAWNGTIDESKLIHRFDIQFAYDIAQNSINTENYHDVHVNTFTPQSFLNLMETFVKLNLLDFKVADFYDTSTNKLEFFISLERMPRNSNREEYKVVQLESVEQARRKIRGI